MAEQGVDTVGLGPARRRWHGGGPPWWNGADGDDTRTRLPWRSTLGLTVVVLVGSAAAAELQQGERAALDPFARVLLLGTAMLLWRWRHPVLVAFGTAATAMVYLGAGYPYGPVFLTVAVGCFSAIVAGHRRAAWTAMGALWAGHVLVAHPAADRGVRRPVQGALGPLLARRTDRAGTGGDGSGRYRSDQRGDRPPASVRSRPRRTSAARW